MGIVDLPSLDSYWRRDAPYRASYVQSRFTRKRFEDILHHLHIADNDEEGAAEDPSAKFGKFLDLLNSVCKQAWNLHFKFSIDEAMVPFQGRLKFLQYAPDKPEKWGIKMFKLVDEAGYMFCCDVYTGARTDKEEDESSIERMVMNLVEPLTGQKPYHLYCDNYYTGVPLALWLKERSIYITGTLRTNRKFIPKEMKAAKLVDKGDSVWIDGVSGITLIKWLDSAEALLLSTAHCGKQLKVVERSDGKGGKIKKNIPAAAADYNENMGPVDQHNQMCSYCTYGRRVTKWWQALFFYFVSIIMTNSWIMYKALNPTTKMALLEFQELIMSHLSADFSSRKRSLGPGSPKSKKGAKYAHSIELKSNPKKQTCGICLKNQPKLWCNTCEIFLHGICVEQHCNES